MSDSNSEFGDGAAVVGMVFTVPPALLKIQSQTSWKKAFNQWLEDQADIAAAKRSIKTQAKPGAKWYTLEEVEKACGI